MISSVEQQNDRDEAESLFKDDREAARILTGSVSGLRKWRKRGLGPKCYRFSRLVRYRVSDLCAWADSHKSE
jgi:hypothetical protein